MARKPRRPVDVYSPPPKSSTRRAAPYTPTSASKHSPRRYRAPARADDADSGSDSDDVHSAYTSSRGSALTALSSVGSNRNGPLNRLSRMLVHPWLADHLPPGPALPQHLQPQHGTKPSPETAGEPQLTYPPLQRQQHKIVWTKGANLFCSGVAALCFIGAFCFDQYFTVDMAGFSVGDDNTERDTIEVSFRDKSTFPPGSPVAGWARQDGLYFYLCYGPLLAACSCGVAVICVAHGKRLRDSLPSSLALALSGAADKDEPGRALQSELYGTVYIKLWIFFILLAFPLVGSASGVTMHRSSIFTVVGFILMVVALLLHMQEQRLRVRFCELQHRLVETDIAGKPPVMEYRRAPAFPPHSASLRPLLNSEPSERSHSPSQSEYPTTAVSPSPRKPAASPRSPRERRRRPHPVTPTAFTEQLAESQFPLEAPSTPKRKAYRKRDRNRPRPLEETDSGLASESAKNEVFADWGEPLQ